MWKSNGGLWWFHAGGRHRLKNNTTVNDCWLLLLTNPMWFGQRATRRQFQCSLRVECLVVRALSPEKNKTKLLGKWPLEILVWIIPKNCYLVFVHILICQWRLSWDHSRIAPPGKNWYNWVSWKSMLQVLYPGALLSVPCRGSGWCTTGLASVLTSWTFFSEDVVLSLTLIWNRHRDRVSYGKIWLRWQLNNTSTAQREISLHRIEFPAPHRPSVPHSTTVIH